MDRKRNGPRDKSGRSETCDRYFEDENMTDETLREALRRRTRPEHERVDALFGRFDLRHALDCIHFMAANHAAYDVLVKEGVSQAEPVRDALASDLETLGHHPEITVPSLGFLPHPDATSYVILGAQLGTQVLRRLWVTSAVPAVRKADSYFGRDHNPRLWQTFCQRLSQLPADDILPRIIIDDTRLIFALFEAAAAEAVTQLEAELA